MRWFDAAGWLWKTVLWFFTALVVGGGVLLIATGAGAWAQENSGLWQEKNRLVVALIVVATIASFGVFDALFWQFIVKGAVEITIVHWFSFWGAMAGIVLFYYRTEYQGKQVFLQRREQIDGRFNAAVTLLGSGEEAARTGAIYSLYHLAVEDEKYRKEVAQILCSHIRSKTQEYGYEEKHEFRPSNEIQTAINLLFRDVDGIDGLYQKTPQALSIADLSHSYLVGARLSGAHCKGADFEKARLQGARFAGAECQGADFEKANSQGADFEEAKCQCAYFGDANYEDVCFISAQCHGANFKKANCHGANFENASFQGACFEEVDHQNANFKGADFRGAYEKANDSETPLYKIHDRANALRKRINQTSELSKMPKDSGMITGVLEDGEDVQKIIEELEEIEKAKEEARK